MKRQELQRFVTNLTIGASVVLGLLLLPACGQSPTKETTGPERTDIETMDKIDEAVTLALQENPSSGDATVQVIVTCSDDCDDVAEALNGQQVTVTQTIAEFGIITAQVGTKHLDFLRSLDQVDSVELDEEVNVDQ